MPGRETGGGQRAVQPGDVRPGPVHHVGGGHEQRRLERHRAREQHRRAPPAPEQQQERDDRRHRHDRGGEGERGQPRAGRGQRVGAVPGQPGDQPVLARVPPALRRVGDQQAHGHQGRQLADHGGQYPERCDPPLCPRHGSRVPRSAVFIPALHPDRPEKASIAAQRVTERPPQHRPGRRDPMTTETAPEPTPVSAGPALAAVPDLRSPPSPRRYPPTAARCCAADWKGCWASPRPRATC